MTAVRHGRPDRRGRRCAPAGGTAGSERRARATLQPDEGAATCGVGSSRRTGHAQDACEDAASRREKTAHHTCGGARPWPSPISAPRIVEQRIETCPNGHFQLEGIRLAQVRDILAVPPPLPVNGTPSGPRRLVCPMLDRAGGTDGAAGTGAGIRASREWGEPV